MKSRHYEALKIVFSSYFADFLYDVIVVNEVRRSGKEFLRVELSPEGASDALQRLVNLQRINLTFFFLGSLGSFTSVSEYCYQYCSDVKTTSCDVDSSYDMDGYR